MSYISYINYISGCQPTCHVIQHRARGSRLPAPSLISFLHHHSHSPLPPLDFHAFTQTPPFLPPSPPLPLANQSTLFASRFLICPPSDIPPTMSSGLQRRRGAPIQTNANGQDDDDHTTSPASHSPNLQSHSASPSTSNGLSSLGSTGNVRGGAMEGRGKIAFDPRDFEDGGESETVPKLTLLEEVLLLGLKDNQVSLARSTASSVIYRSSLALGVCRRTPSGRCHCNLACYPLSGRWTRRKGNRGNGQGGDEIGCPCCVRPTSFPPSVERISSSMLRVGSKEAYR